MREAVEGVARARGEGAGVEARGDPQVRLCMSSSREGCSWVPLLQPLLLPGRDCNCCCCCCCCCCWAGGRGARGEVGQDCGRRGLLEEGGGGGCLS